MSWTRSGPLRPDHRSRLLASGVLAEVLDGLALSEVTAPLPDWWHDHGNALYLQRRMSIPPAMVEVLTTYPFRDALIVCATGMEFFSSVLVGGDGATVFVGPNTFMTSADLYCGAGSTIVLNADVVATGKAIVDARNGGTIVAQPDQLWAAGAYVVTDDMHRLEDLETGARINPYGAHVRLGRHVWLGRDAIVSGHVEIGDGAVVGMRSMVRNQKVAAHTAVAGTPARVIREGVTWRGEDTP
jgi:acetyltransferase-like isoleucine patch superfamily enzyme